MRDSEAVLALRRELGVRLKALRLAAGYTQPQLARTTGYSRSTISTVEGGGQNVPLTFWERCDQVLETGGALTAEFGRVEGQRDAERRELARREAAARAGALRAVHLAGPGQLGPGPHALSLADAARAYQDVGWPVEQTGGRLVLVTGDAVDALEVPRAAGVLAVRWWLFTGGAQDEVRGLPTLPPPQESLAVVTAGDRFWFLVQAGAFPWRDPAVTATDVGHESLQAAVSWHARGSAIPLPPSPFGSDRQAAEWVRLPAAGIRLADPVALLDLLAKAVAAISGSGRGLTMPGGVPVVPAVPPGRLGSAGSNW